jgi:sugar phosphate isomerase/epimerase
MTRRTFFKKAGADVAVAGVLGARMMTAHASPLGLPIGSQTYPHRALIQSGHFADLAATLAAMGVTALEMCSPFSYDEFAPLKDGKATRAVLAGHGLVSESGHFDMDELRHQQGRAIAWAHEVGITQMVTATLNGPMKPTMDDVKRAADEYNRIAAAAKKEGIQQGLHNEGFEISQVDGRRTYDVLIELLDPALVKFQFQMSTIGYGFVAAEYFRKYPGRFNSMHVQDVDLKAPHPAAASDDDDPKAKGVQVPVGKGSIDWAATFEAAKVGGVKSYYVEQNMAFTKESVAYLKALHV